MNGQKLVLVPLLFLVLVRRFWGKSTVVKRSASCVNCQDIHPVGPWATLWFAVLADEFDENLSSPLSLCEMVLSESCFSVQKQALLSLYPGQKGFVHWAKRKHLDCRCLSWKEGAEKASESELGCWVDGVVKMPPSPALWVGSRQQTVLRSHS